MTIAISGTTGITLAGQFDSASSMGFKNRLINGAMAISQRGTSFTTGAGSAYMVDRWQVGATQVSKITGTQSTTSTNGFTYSQGLTVASAFSSGAADIFYLTQGIEGFNVADLAWGTANAAPITISFWVRGSLTGTYSAFVRNAARNRSYIATFTINSANTFEQKTITIAGDTSGTWATDNTEGINFGIDLGSGTNYNGTASTWTGSNVFRTSGSVSWVANASATLFLTGVQLEKGSTATSFDYRPYGTELALCQRYYWSTNSSGSSNNFIAWIYAVNTTNAYGYLYFPVSMRTFPSAVTYAGTGWWAGGAVTATSSISIAESGTGSATLLFVSTGYSANVMYAILPNGTANYVALTAEL